MSALILRASRFAKVRSCFLDHDEPQQAFEAAVRSICAPRPPLLRKVWHAFLSPKGKRLQHVVSRLLDGPRAVHATVGPGQDFKWKNVESW